MSLFGTIQQSAGALSAAQLGIQVAGNNIANVNTPGFVRQQLQQAPAETVQLGGLLVGSGVRPLGVVQVIDQQLAERLFNAGTDLAGAETLEAAFSQLEQITGDLENNGINQQLTLFNNALNDLSVQPGDPSLREFVILQASTLANSLQQNRNDAISRQALLNDDVDQFANDINRLTSRIAALNVEIASIEGGGLLNSDASGLRDQRLADLEELSQFANLNIQELPGGGVNVFVAGDFLVASGLSREVESAFNLETGANEIRIVDTDSPLEVTSGRIAATVQARDGAFGQYIEQINAVAAGLIQTVNQIHSQGQGSEGFQQVLSSNIGVTGVPLEDAGLPFVPSNGSFDISVLDESRQILRTERINVQRLGQIDDSTIQSIVAEINAIEGIAADVTAGGQIEIVSDSPATSFVFADDTSGFLAATGINTFFTGNDALDIAVNPALLDRPSLLAVSRNGVGEDTEVLTDLVDAIERPTDSLNGQSVRSTYEQTITSLGQQISFQTSATEGLRNFRDTLQAEHLSITGVNIDEESIRLISFQRAFQASSRVIATSSELLELLVSL